MSSKSIPLKIKILLFLFVVGCLNAQITSYPYVEDFESGPGGWSISALSTSPVTSWQLGLPANTFINYAASGTNAWITSLSGQYLANENGWVESPVFDLSSLISPNVQLSIWWHSESDFDGAVLQSSIDSGISWQNVGAYGDSINWFNDNSLNGFPGGQVIGWSGSNITEWKTAIHSLSNLAGQTNVIFRVAFGSDGSIEYNGFAFDNFKILDNPCYAGENNSASVCGGITQIDLNEYLSSNADFDGIWTALDELQIDDIHIITASAIQTSGTFRFKYTVTTENENCIDEAIVTLTIEKALSSGENGTYDCSTLLSTDELFTALGGTPDPGGRWEPNEGDASFGNAGTYRYIHDATENCPESSSEIIFTASLPDAGFDREYFVEIENDIGEKNLDSIILAKFGKNSANYKKPISSRWTFSSGPREAPVDDTGNVDFPNTGAGPEQAYVFVYTLENDCGEEDSAIITIYIIGWNPTNEESTIEICEEETLTAQDLFDSLTKEGLRDFDNVWLDANNSEVSFPVGAGTYFYEDFSSNTANVTVTALPVEPAAFNGESFSYDANCLGVTKTDFFNIMGITDENEKIGVFYYCEKVTGLCNYEEEVDFTNPVGDGKYSYELINAGNCISDSTAEITVSGYPIADAGEEPLEPILIDYNEFIDPEGISDLDEVLSFWRDSNSNKFNSKKLVAQSSWSFKSGQRTLTVTDDGGVDFPNTGAGLPWLYEFEYTITEDACGGSTDTIIVAVDVQGFEMNQEASLTICSGTTITDSLLVSTLSPNLNWNEPGVWTQNTENPNIYNGIDLLDNTAEVTITEITPDPPDAGPDREYYLIWGEYNLNDVLIIAETGKNVNKSAKVISRWSFLSGTRPATVDHDGNVDFPNTGAGNSENFTFIYTVENECGETDEAIITFYINDNLGYMYDITICDGDTLTKQDLFYLITSTGYFADVRYFNGDFTDFFTEEPITFPVSEGSYEYNDWTGNTAYFNVFRANSLNTKVFLQGAMLNPNAGEEHLMRDDLRALGHLPTTSPYDDTTCNTEVFEAIGDDAIVDWVLIEFRRGSLYNYAVSDTRSALLQRDGDIVGMDGITPLCLIDIGPSYNTTYSQQFKITIKHRNHLGIMTANDISVGKHEEDAYVDFTDANNTITFGTNAQGGFSMPNGVLGMWAGDADGDGNVAFGNDGNQTLFDVLFHPNNVTYSSSYSLATGYLNSDMNLDGVVSFQDDLNKILTNVIFYPGNTTYNSSYSLFNEQIPITESGKAIKEKLAEDNQQYILDKINQVQQN